MNSLASTIPVTRLLKQLGCLMSAVPLALGVTPRSGAAQTAQPSFAFGPETIVVNTAEEFGDGDGTVSFSDAIRRANGNQNPEFVDVIEFAIPGAAPHTIVLEETSLPEITQPVRIDGTTQPGYDGAPVIVIDGTNLRAFSTGLTLRSERSAVLSLSIINFTGGGISLFSDNNRVSGCYIGLDAGGQPAGNDVYGVHIRGDGNAIGGLSSGTRNVISSNAGEGISISSGNANVVLGNYIGTDPSATSALGNGGAGINIRFSSFRNVVGGPASSARNVISGNEGNGILLQGGDGDPIGTVILGNYIGTDAGGEAPLPNSGGGVELNSAFATLVGGTDARASNRIAFNGADGISIVDPLSAGNVLRRNVVFQNAGLGIDLGGDGPTANDPGDGDTGPNALQNFPEIIEARFNNRQNELTVTYRVPSDPQHVSYPLAVDFYRADTNDEEGEAYLGTNTYTAGDFGEGPDKTVTFAPQASLTTAGVLVATATDTSGNTSEFSVPLALPDPEISVVPAMLDFGRVLVGQESTDTFVIENTGGTDLEVGALTISGPNASAFVVVGGDAPATIPPGQVRQVEMGFAPPSAGDKAATLTVESNAGAEQVGLSGQGLGPPTATTEAATSVAASSATLHGTVNPGGAETVVTFEYFPTGNSDAAETVTAEQSPLTGTNDQAVSAGISGLNPGVAYTFRVIAANEVGSDTGADRTFTTRAPELTVEPLALDFGGVPVGETGQQPVAITNDGDAALEVADLLISGSDAEAFSVAGVEVPLVLAPGALREVEVAFTPSSAGAKAAVLTVESSAGTAQVTLSGEGISVQVSVEEDPPANTDLGIAALFSSTDFQPITSELFYRQTGQAGAESYQAVPFAEEGGAFVATIPAGAVTLRGVEYYARFSDGQRTFTFPATDPVNTPVRVRVVMDRQPSPVVPLPRAYRMVSVPVALEEPAIGAVLEDDYGRQEPSRWRLLRWDPEAERYREFPGIDEALEPGHAFWLTTRDGGGFDVEQGLSVDASAPRLITLRPGWNQIANPFAFPVAWEDVARSDVVEAPLFFNGEGYEVQPARVLAPWEGYFVYNNGAEPVTISVPPVEALASEAVPSGAPALEADYALRLQAQHERLRDTRTVVGFAGAAAQGRDRLDVAEPPGVGDYVRLSIIQDGERLDGSFKPPGGEGQWWDLEVSLTLEGERPSSARRVTVTLASEQGRLPEGYQRYVFDQDAGQVLSVEGQRFSVDVDEDRPLRHLRLVLGTPAFAKMHTEGAPLEPVAFALEKNVPNPFDTETTLRYRLARRCQVVLEVYNVLGQRVATLVDAEQDAGPHEVAWKTGGLAPGVYFYRIQAGSFTASRKMILLR